MASLDAVIAAPDNDAPRVAYADAIAATDPDRAELIRLQLALTRWRKTHEDPPERTAASTRSRVLLDKHKAEWSATVGPLVAGCAFLRGFVELVALDATRFLSIAPALYKLAPIRHLDLSGVKPVAAALFASPHLARIESLSLLRNSLDDADVELLANSPNLGHLTWLDLGLNAITAAGLDSLAASTRLPAWALSASRAIPSPIRRRSIATATSTPRRLRRRSSTSTDRAPGSTRRVARYGRPIAMQLASAGCAAARRCLFGRPDPRAT